MPVYRDSPMPASALVVAYPGKVVAYDPTSGHERWSYEARRQPLRGKRPTKVAVTDDRVYLLTQHVQDAGFMGSPRTTVELVALNYATGAVLWTQVVDRGELLPYFWMALVVKGELVFVAHADVIVAIDPATGAIRWCREVDRVAALALAGCVDEGG